MSFWRGIHTFPDRSGEFSDQVTHSGTESEILALKAGILVRNSYILGQKSHPLRTESRVSAPETRDSGVDSLRIDS